MPSALRPSARIVAVALLAAGMGASSKATGASALPSPRPDDRPQVLLSVSVREQRACGDSGEFYSMVFRGPARYQNRGREELVLESADPLGWYGHITVG